MRANTDTRKKKLAPVICAVAAMLFFAVYAGIFIYPLLCENMEGFVLKLILAIYVLLAAAAIVGVGAALLQRMKEIDGGEEEAAKKY